MTPIHIDRALELLLANAHAATASEIVAVTDALGRVNAQPFTVRRALPPFDNSAMDGYAVKLADHDQSVRVSGVIYAGKEPLGEVKAGEAIKIMTGAQIPLGTEAVVPFEIVELIGETHIKLPRVIGRDQHIRFAGEELKVGDTLLAQGAVITPAAAALLASQGITEIAVRKLISIAVMASGDEVVEPHETPKSYQIYNTNSTAISLTLRRAGFNAQTQTITADEPNALAGSLRAAFAHSDAVIVTGGISTGERDYTKKAFELIGGETLFHGLNFKPGKPTMAGVLQGKLFFALPGNPLSSLANLYLLVLPALRKLQGANAYFTDVIIARNEQSFDIKGDRITALLGTVENGRFRVAQGGKQGSGMLTPLLRSNAFAVFDSAVARVAFDAPIKTVLLAKDPTAAQMDIINRG